MPDRTPDRTPPGTQQDTNGIILSVAEAAARLGTTPDAVRARLQRGTLPGEKVAGVWRVHLSESKSDRHPTGHQQDSDGTRQDADRTADSPLVEQLRSENAYLRGQLDTTLRQLATERERADVLMREALGRIEALSSGDAPVASPEPHHGAEPPAAGDEPWLRRWWRGLAERLYTR